MKNIIGLYAFLIITALMFQTCNHSTKEISRGSTDFKSDSTALIEIHCIKTRAKYDSKLVRIIKEYIQQDIQQNHLDKIYRLIVEQKGFEPGFRLTSAVSYQQLAEYFPSGYFMIDGKVVVIHNGLEKFIEPDTAFIKELKGIFRTKIKGDFFKQMPATYEPMVWQIRYNENGTLIVDKRAAPPYKIKFGNPIKFYPPNKDSAR